MGNSNNTINKKLKRLKRLLKTEGKQRENNSLDWFSSLYLKSEKTEVTRLTRDQILAMESLELSDDLLEKTRDCFLFSYYNAGIRFSDLCRLRWNNIVDGRLVYKMSKTSALKNIKLLPKSVEILEKYSGDKSKGELIFHLIPDGLEVLPEMKRISSANVSFNKRLKRLSKLVGIEASISSHTARHSFADYARKSNMSLYDISKALGHSDISITKEYLASFDETSLDESMESLFNN